MNGGLQFALFSHTSSLCYMWQPYLTPLLPGEGTAVASFQWVRALKAVAIWDK